MSEKSGMRKWQMSASLKCEAPINGETVSLLHTDWLALIAERREGGILGVWNPHEDDLAFPEPVHFSWRDGNPPFTLTILEKKDVVRTVCEDANSVDVLNLKTGTEYTWFVTDPAGRRSETGRFQTAYGPRLIALPEREHGPINLRDLGGRMSCFGGRVRQEMVYRGSDYSMFRQSCEDNLAFVRDDLAVRTEIDLRYHENVVNRTGSDLGESVNCIHRPINAYNSFIPEQCDLFRDTIRLFSREELYPIFFHCNGGNDRTGEVAFLLNALLGVHEVELLLDYELSSLSVFRTRRTMPYFVDWREKIASYAPPESPWHIRVERYLLTIGVTQNEIDAIRSILLEA